MVNKKMIMKKTFYFVSAALVAFVACTKETPAPEQTEQPISIVEQNQTTIYASIDDTKSEVNTTTGAFTWAVDEFISVAPASGTEYNNTFKCATPAEGAFTGTGEAGPIAISPMQSEVSYTNETNYQVKLRDTYSYVDGVTNALMVGTKVDASKYQFKHAAALLVVTYNNVPVNTSALKVTSTTGSQKLTGTVSLSGTGTSEIEISNDNTGLTGNGVTITFDKTDANVPSMTFYVPLPTGTYDAITFELVNDDSELQASTLKTLKNATLNRADVYVIPAVQLVAGFVPVRVGETNFSSNWNSKTHSSAFEVPLGSVLHMEFVNHSSKNNIWSNWNLFVTNMDYADPTPSGYHEYFVLRSDNYGWGDKNYHVENLTTEWPVSDEIYKEFMDGATVSLTVEHTITGNAFITARATKDATTYNKTYHQVVSPTESVYAFLWCDESYFEIKKVWLSVSKTTITSIATTGKYYVGNEDLDISKVGIPYVNAVFSNGVTAPIDPDPSVLTGTVSHGVTGNTNIPITINGRAYTLTANVIHGEGFGSPSFENNWDTTYDGDAPTAIPSGETKTIKLHVYSLGELNWQAPVVRLYDGETIKASLRIDHYGFDGFDNEGAGNRDSNWDWFRFSNFLNDMEMTITITDNGSNSATVRYDAIRRDGTSYYQLYNNISVISGNLSYRICVEHCYAIIHE